MPELKQGMITRFFSKKDRNQHRSGSKKLSEEDLKLKAYHKQVGEETRAAYSTIELHDPRVKSAYSTTHMTTRCPPIPQDAARRFNTEVVVVDSDTLDAAENLHTTVPQPAIGVMNMASERHIGGGFLSGAPAQEESLCRRTTLYPCLLSVKDRCYPLSATAVLISPDVIVFRRGADDNFTFMTLDKVFFITVLSVAAIRNPKIHNGRFENHTERQLTLTKIRETLRAGYHASCRQLVLGALGCGAFHNPPQAVAEAFREVLLEPEFTGAFEKIVFAIVDHKNLTYGKRRTDNHLVFSQTLQNLRPASAPNALPAATNT